MNSERLTRINVETSSRSQLIDITREVRKAVASSGVSGGSCLLFVPHTTAGVTINENADPDVTADITAFLNKKIPLSDPGFRHSEGNSDAHIKSTLTGTSLDVIISEGDLLLGTWQGIYFCEYDGPRSRKLYIKIRPDSG